MLPNSEMQYRLFQRFAFSVLRCRHLILEMGMTVSGLSALPTVVQEQRLIPTCSEIICFVRENHARWICFQFFTPVFLTLRLINWQQVKTETHWQTENLSSTISFPHSAICFA